MLPAVVPPPVLLGGRQHQDQFDRRIEREEMFDGMPQNRLPADLQELFGPVGAHPDTLPAGHDYRIAFHP